VVEPEEASDALRLSLSGDIDGWRVQRDEQRKHLAAETLVQREVTAHCDDLVVGMGRHDEYTLLLNGTESKRHTVRDAVDSAEETCRRALKYAIEKWRWKVAH
jgi:hypothetical protein